MNIVKRYNIQVNSLSNIKNVWDNIMNLNFSVSREMAPIYSMGYGIGFERNRQSVTGSFALHIQKQWNLNELVKVIEQNGILHNYNNTSYKFSNVIITNVTMPSMYNEVNADDIVLFSFSSDRLTYLN